MGRSSPSVNCGLFVNKFYSKPFTSHIQPFTGISQGTSKRGPANLFVKGHTADQQKLLNLANVSQWLSRYQAPKTARARHDPCHHKSRPARGKQLSWTLCVRCWHRGAQSRTSCYTEATISGLKGRERSRVSVSAKDFIRQKAGGWSLQSEQERVPWVREGKAAPCYCHPEEEGTETRNPERKPRPSMPRRKSWSLIIQSPKVPEGQSSESTAKKIIILTVTFVSKYHSCNCTENELARKISEWGKPVVR